MSDLELQTELAKMLPEKMVYDEAFKRFHWLEESDRTSTAKKVSWPGIQNTEWLHACWLIEQDVPYDNSIKGRVAYDNKLMTICGSHQACVSASWQQRAKALIAVKS